MRRVQFPGKGVTVRYRPMTCSQQQQQAVMMTSSYVMAYDGGHMYLPQPAYTAVIPASPPTYSVSSNIVIIIILLHERHQQEQQYNIKYATRTSQKLI